MTVRPAGPGRLGRVFGRAWGLASGQSLQRFGEVVFSRGVYIVQNVFLLIVLGSSLISVLEHWLKDCCNLCSLVKWHNEKTSKSKARCSCKELWIILGILKFIKSKSRFILCESNFQV